MSKFLAIGTTFLFVTTGALAGGEHSNMLALANINSANQHQIVGQSTPPDSDAWEQETIAFIESYQDRDIAQAKIHAQNALQIAHKVYGARHVNTADSLNKMGIVFEASGMLQQAQLNYEKSLEILIA